MSSKVRKAVFPVAGLGTRFLPATKALPKEMLPVVDRPLIQYAVQECLAAGIEEFIFVAPSEKPSLRDHFAPNPELADKLRADGKDELAAKLEAATLDPDAIRFAIQEAPLGLGHAVWCAREVVGDEPFAVLLPDELLIGDPGATAELAAAHERSGGNAISVVEVPADMTHRYGIVTPGANEAGGTVEVRGMVEKPKPGEAPSRLAIVGRYVLVPEIFELLEQGERGAGNEIQLTDAMAKLIGVSPFHAVTFAGRRFDCGQPGGFLEANVALALERPDLGPDLRRDLERLL